MPLPIPLLIFGTALAAFTASCSSREPEEVEIEPSSDPEYNHLCADATQRLKREFRGPLNPPKYQDDATLEPTLYLESDPKLLEILKPANQCRYASTLWTRQKFTDPSDDVGDSRTGRRVLDLNGCYVNEDCRWTQTRETLGGVIVPDDKVTDRHGNGLSCVEIESARTDCGGD